ncbi:MAG: translation initiation factor IF-2 [Verrucomicrobia bacterium]|nr:translation initiation factor IF-2 [Verrucomicrobiota bacterium]
MPVRIYDIARKLGIESKDVLTKAKDLGIKEAKVPSSSLDKITAEYLEEQLGGVKVAPAPAPVPESQPVLIVAPPEPPLVVAEQGVTFVHAAPETAGAVSLPAPEMLPTMPAPGIAVISPATVAPGGQPTPVVEARATPVTPPAPPPVPAGPVLGQKVGSIAPTWLKSPSARTATRISEPAVPAAKPAAPKPTFAPKSAPRPPAPARPAEPKFVPLAEGELIIVKPPIMVRELADRMKLKPFQLIGDLMELKVFAKINDSVDELVAQKICAKRGFRFEVEKRARGEGQVHAPVRKVEVDVEDKPEDLRPRPPVVTIMGHVDHGKTTLLDGIRKANVAEGEAGGITQHIGAYTISFPHPERKTEVQQITFLDTPGHAAFSAMRARGANVTDIVILVVAANDGVMPQTLEALSHARAAKVPILVAVNKCDHPNANPMKVRQQLQDKGLTCEEWGGETIFVDCSGLTKQGVDKLLEMLLLQAEVIELKANPARRARGNVIESGLEPGGPVATVLVRKGTLKVGDVVICGHFFGKVKALINEEGKRLKEATPSVAVKILGLNGIPEAGIEFSVMENEKAARELAGTRAMEAKAIELEERKPKVTLENLFSTLAEAQNKVLKVVVKADTQGSVEAIESELGKIGSDRVALETVHGAVGTITESDVLLAAASKGIILGFHTRIDTGVADIAKHQGVQIKLYTIIYELIDEVKDAMAGLLDPVLKEVVLGSAEVRKLFALSKGGNVAGCVVSTGRITRGKVRVMRRKGLIYEGAVTTLRRFQDEVSEVRAGMECGIRLESFNDFQPGDLIESYSVEKVKQTL